METKHLVVGAIDIGTTYSGWAFSFVHDFERDPTKATLKNWDCYLLDTKKTPTCLLIKPDRKTLKDFGYAAEDRYIRLTDDGKQNNYYYFKRFKTNLKKKLEEKSTLDWSITLEDEMGRSFPALDVYSMCIKYLADDMVNEINKRISGGGCSDQDIYWVLTVPAAWPEGAKQFMREAAFKAGCSRNKLTIALESEAASTYCKHLSDEQTVYKTNGSLSQLKAGTKYMILDAGGVTVDVSVHEVGEAGNVKQVSVVNGGCIGGIIVDDAFKDMLIEVLGKTVYDQLQEDNSEAFLDLSRGFEVKKRSCKPDSLIVTVRFPPSLMDGFRSITGKSISDALASSSFRDLIKLSSYDKMRFQALQSFFDASVTSIIRCVKKNITPRESRSYCNGWWLLGISSASGSS
ncbi:heat shock 70 kDa protein 12A-like isoform X2 [Mercenaria mercenaria]|uniref:heat shock 70 kDa protein 12A-like isoform X2 n=1 Tax=Mercenaria mercenaria TaxID=6596 RepID=UPI00234E4F09|nr:heat shock 70 kDa protein 12A-like isoform X2 [Mercenaria mercenaria]